MNPTSLKSTRLFSNDPWAILIALASLIIVATGVAIVVICILYKRYKASRLLYEQTYVPGLSFELPTTSLATVLESRPKEYEIQSLDMFVPNEERDLDIIEGAIHGNNGLRQSHHPKELQLMQSQLPDHELKYSQLSGYLEQEISIGTNENQFYKRTPFYHNDEHSQIM